MDVHVSLAGDGNLSTEIYRQVRQAILDGRLRPGDRLPATRELARRLSVSRTTATAAYDRLSAGGFVTSRVGAGTFVTDSAAVVSGPDRVHPAEGPLRARPVWDSIQVTTAFRRQARFDFRSGLPDASLFPHGRWRRLVAARLRAETVGAGSYAEPAGQPELREAIARHIGVSRGVVTSADDITITNGTQQALDLLARVLLAPGDLVAVEDPGYPPPRLLFHSLGMCTAPTPVDAQGLVVGDLPAGTRLVYTTPAHQYPLGTAMSAARRAELLRWADRHDAAIVEDDYDSEFRFGGKPIEPLRALDTSGRVVYVGSFSKTMLPTLRLGFIVSPPALRDAVRRAKYLADWHTTLCIQQALARFIDEGGFARHVRRMNRVYEARHRMIVSTLARDFADRLEVLPSDTGLHVCATACADDAGAIAEVARRATDVGVEVQQLSRYAASGRARAGLVLGYGAIRTEHVEEGLRRLRRCFESPT